MNKLICIHCKGEVKRNYGSYSSPVCVKCYKGSSKEYKKRLDSYRKGRK
jgi:hypothetical protein